MQVVRELQVYAVRKLILVLVDECHGAFERIFAVGHGFKFARARASRLFLTKLDKEIFLKIFLLKSAIVIVS